MQFSLSLPPIVFLSMERKIVNAERERERKKASQEFGKGKKENRAM